MVILARCATMVLLILSVVGFLSFAFSFVVFATLVPYDPKEVSLMAKNALGWAMFSFVLWDLYRNIRK